MGASNTSALFLETDTDSEENDFADEKLTRDDLPQYRWRSRRGPAREIDEQNLAGGRIERDEDSALSLYVRKAGKAKLLSRTEELELSRRAEMGDALARQKLITANLRLVMNFAKRFMNRGLDLEDLIQEGNLGLIRAAQLFKSDKGVKFSTYASMWIIQSITRAIDNKSRTVRLPVTLIRDIKKIRRISTHIQQTSGVAPSPEELAQLSKLSLHRVKVALESSEHPLSLNHESEGSGAELLEQITYKGESAVEDEAERSLGFDKFEKLVDVLNKDELTVIGLRYGFFGYEDMTYQQISTMFDCHPSKAKRIHDNAIRKMQQKNLRLLGQAQVESERRFGEFAL